MSARKNASRRAVPSTRASRIADAEEKKAGTVGNAAADELATVAKRDGATFVSASTTARAHVRHAPPSTARRDEGPELAERLADGADVGTVVYGGPADALVASRSGEIRRLVARFAVVDLAGEPSRPLTSHQPSSWARTPGYPDGAQERDYSGDAGEQLKVAAIAARPVPEFLVNTNPDALNGPPVVDTAGVALGGNGRTMGMRLAYERGRGAGYRAALVERAKVFGIEPRALDPFKAPLLVRVVVVNPTERAELSRRLNEGQTQEKRAGVDAASLAARLTSTTLSTLTPPADQTVRAWLRTPAARPFIAALATDGVITRQTSSRYLAPDGGLTDDGATLVERLLLAWALPDVAVVEGIGDARRYMVARVVPALASALAAGHDMRPLIREAAEQTREADTRSSTPAALQKQGGLFLARETTPAALALAELLHARSRRFAETVRAAALAAERNPAAQGGLFGTPASVDELVTEAARAP